jgi:uncharacterized membrane protein
MMLFLLVKWVHILAAIAAVGSNITYGLWVARARRDQKALSFILRNIKLVDDRIANPAYVLLLVTGLMMVYIIGFSIKTPWILTSLVLYVIMAAIGLFLFTPNLRRQIRLLEDEGLKSAKYKAVARRGKKLGVVLGVLVMMIIFLMVVKPGLWAGIAG